MKNLFLMIFFAISASAAHASCWNNFDIPEDSPYYRERHFVTCFAGSCIDDQMIWECASLDWMGAAFDGGLEVRCSTSPSGEGYNAVSNPSACQYFLGGYELSSAMAEQLSCTSVEADEAGCMWFPN